MQSKRRLILLAVTFTVVFGLFIASPLYAGTEQVLYDFCSVSGCTDGVFPYAGLIFDASGNLYGTTYNGGSGSGCEWSCGTVFELSPGTTGNWTEKVLHSFASNGHDGTNPVAALIFDASGNLYGTTGYGGASSSCSQGCGTVFELTPGTNGNWTEKVLHSFNGKNGSTPAAGLIFDGSENLYGTTAYGGAKGYGIVFELAPGANGKWTEKVLHSFQGKDGAQPAVGELIFDASGNLYGVTVKGGAHNYGTVFELSPGTDGKWTEKVLHSFSYNGKDGIWPAGQMVDASGNLYGTTEEGGASSICSTGCGTVFELSPGTNGKWKERVLYSFNPSINDGYFPEAGLISDASGNLYGTTAIGGTSGAGAVFELMPGTNGTWTETVLYSFTGTSGYDPAAGLILDASGNLYGTTVEGGTSSTCSGGCGTVFEVTP